MEPHDGVLALEHVALDAETLAQVLQRVADHAVTTLRLRHAELKPGLAVQLADFLETNSTLTHLDVAGNPLGAHGAACLASSLAANRTLQSLSLADCKLHSDALAAWVAFFQANGGGAHVSLRQLSLANNQLDDDGAEALGAMLRAVRASDTSFDLRGNELGERGMRVLAEAMSSATVTTLRLERNQDEDAATTSYRKRVDFYLRRNREALQRQQLQQTIRGVAASSLALQTCHLTRVEISLPDADALAAALRCNRSVTDLRLEDNALPEEATRRLVRALDSNLGVRMLAIVDNSMGDGGFRALSDLLRSPTSALRAVTIASRTPQRARESESAMLPRTASALHYTLANFSLLASLSLVGCALDDRLAGVLLSGVAWSGRVEALDLRGNALGDRSVHVLARLLQRCLRLYRLDVSSNDFSLAGLLPLLPRVSAHAQLRMLLLGRFRSYDEDAVRQVLVAADRSEALVTLELETAHRRAHTAERVEQLNARLHARHGAAFELERRLRERQEEAHLARCRRRALVRIQALEVAQRVTKAGTLSSKGG